MAYRLIIVPGANEVLRALPGQLNDDVAVQLFETANEALWEVRNHAPEVLIADVDLDGMSGLDLAEILPNFGAPTRMVLCSRQPDPRAAQQAHSHGVFQYLDAPSSDAVNEAVRAALRAAPPAPAAEPEPEPAAPAPEPKPQPRPAPQPVAEQPKPAPEPTKTAEPAKPTEPPKPAPAVAPAPARRPGSRRNTLVLTADNLAPIRERMNSLRQEVGAQCILLSNREGMALTDVGNTSGIPTMVLLPLLSTSFSAAGQISQMLRERDSSALYMQEGSHFDLYCFDVAQQFMLVLIFDKASSATKIGTAWVYTKRAIRDMLEYLAQV